MCRIFQNQRNIARIFTLPFSAIHAYNNSSKPDRAKRKGVIFMKRILAMLLVTVLLSALFAVGASAETLSGELVISVGSDWLDESSEQGKAFMDALRAYEAAHPDVKLTAQGASQQDIKESFQTAALAGGGPDVVIMDNSGHAIDLAAMGLLLPLNQFITDEELTATYQPGPLNSGRFEGVYYSIPWYMDCCGLYCNTDYLDACDLPIPETWEDLENCLAVLKENGYGGIITYKSAYAFYSFFYQNECPVIDTTGETPVVVIDNEAGTEAWNYICRLIMEDNGLVESFKEATSWDKVYESFANGEATFLLGGDWCKSGINGVGTNVNYTITDMVQGKTRATILGGWTWNINANTRYPELAYGFCRYMSSPETYDILKVTGKHSARTDWDVASGLSEDNQDLVVLGEQFPYTMARPAIINEKTVDEIITNAILTVVYGQANAEESLAALAEELRENIAANYGA